jgi:hypothetical protein
MEESCEFQGCSEKAAISFRGKTYKVQDLVQAVQSFRVDLGEFLYRSWRKKEIEIYPGHQQPITPSVSARILYEKYFDEGVECEILDLGSEDWVKGKMRLRLSLEFVLDPPAEPELAETEDQTSPDQDDVLDAIREASADLHDGEN